MLEGPEASKGEMNDPGSQSQLMAWFPDLVVMTAVISALGALTV